MSIEDASRCVEGSIELYIELYIEDVEARTQPPPPVGPLLSQLLLPLGAVPLSSLRIVAPQVYPAPLSPERLF